jgi:hypothetical protein
VTEAEWLTCESSVRMLHDLNPDCNGRKVMLYAVAVFLRVPGLLTEVMQEWVELAERVAAGQATDEDLEEFPWINLAAENDVKHYAEHDTPSSRAQYAAIGDVLTCNWMIGNKEFAPVNPVPPEELEPVRRANADLLREVFGNPFRPVTFDSAWRTSTAIALATQMYESRDFGAMPILADALQDAGCDNEDVLNHCREAKQVHVRGCWVVDLVLGEE